MTSNMMGDDEQVRKELADRYAEAKLKAEEMKDAKVSEINIPDALVDDVIGMMAGTTDKGIRVRFVDGPLDGVVEFMRTTPDVLPKRCGAPQVQFVGKPVAISVFYEVAVYELVVGDSGPFYQFEGYSECMEGLG